MMTTEVIEVWVDDVDLIVVEVGDQGAPGLSAYQLAVKNGFMGNEAAWLQSLSVSTDNFEPDLVTIYSLFK